MDEQSPMVKKTRGKMIQPTKSELKQENIKMKEFISQINRTVNFDFADILDDLGIFDIKKNKEIDNE